MWRVSAVVVALGLVGAACSGTSSTTETADSANRVTDTAGDLADGVAEGSEGSVDGPGGGSATTLADDADGVSCAGTTGEVPGDVPENRIISRSIESVGGSRDYLVYVPATYTADEPVPLVFTFHGAGSNKEQQIAYSNFGPLADEDGWIVVAPDSLGEPKRWSPYGVQGEVRDLDFFDDLLVAVQDEFCIDPERVFAAGMSSGGFMSTTLACERSEVIAAVGPVTATMWAEGACSKAEPMPYVYFHGTADPVVPFLGPLPESEERPGSAETSASKWAEHNGCDGEPTDERIGTEIIRRVWNDCDAVTELYIVEGGGHTWPGGAAVNALGYTTQEISASEIIWELFSNSTRGS